MTDISRIRVHIKRTDDSAWTVTFEDADGNSIGIGPRTMRRLDDLPLPPEDDLPDAGTPHHELCTPDGLARVRKYLRKISKRDIEGDIVEHYGRYLFSCLLGSRWQDLGDAIPEHNMLDIALCIEDDKDPLHRLHWEMMHGPDNFIGKGQPRRVSVSRAIDSDVAPKKSESPPRILFVIGAELNDSAIRSGAEVVGLLRDIQHNGRSIHSRILQNASPERIREDVARFQPDIVHFICHGGIKGGEPFIELETDDDDQERNKSAEQIHTILDAAETPPRIVVLSACYSASAGESAGMEMRPEDTAPFATQLVRKGIPIVVAMSGRVSDLACRLFTRCFGEAIIDGESLVVAAERGRRIAFSDAHKPRESVDWAYPTLFLASGVPVDFTPFDPAKSQSYVELEDRYCGHHGFDPARPVFCGRDDIFEEYYRLFEQGGPSVLAVRDEHPVESEAQIGRTRLLQTLGLQSLRDGHIPCLIGGDKEAGWKPPRTIRDFAYALDQAVKDTREMFNVDRNHRSELFRLRKSRDLVEHISDPATDITVSQALDELDEPELTIKVVRAALSADLKKAIQDIGEEHSRFAKARVVVLLDDAHLYDKLLSPLLSEGLTASGLGIPLRNDYQEIVPVVMIMGQISSAEQIMKPFLEKAKKWLHEKKLERFKDGEDILAYERVILYPYADNLLKKVSDRAWVRNRDASDDDVDEWHALLCESEDLQRMPSDFLTKDFYYLVQTGKFAKVLVRATDDDLLDKLRNDE